MERCGSPFLGLDPDFWQQMEACYRPLLDGRAGPAHAAGPGAVPASA